jgi:tRNA (guanine37-N1)-methyltransferase
VRIDILTLFPGMFQGPFAESIIKRAIERKLVSIYLHNIRDYATDKHHIVDDYPYGGGVGMVMKPEPIFATVETVKGEIQQTKPQTISCPIILLTPQGRLFHQRIAEELATQEQLILICGHYEGVDERVREHLVTDEISIGDYVLTGGELAAMVMVDAVVRRLPGVLGSESAAAEESHARGLLEYPQYTRPAAYRGWAVPEILLSGNHAEIAHWRRVRSMRRTLQRRPDLLAKAELTEEERKLLDLEKGKTL